MDFNEIYVSFGSEDAPCQYDGDGIAICNDNVYPIAGTESNPLSFQQFRDYVRSRRLSMVENNGDTKTFRIRGTFDQSVFDRFSNPEPFVPQFSPFHVLDFINTEYNGEFNAIMTDWNDDGSIWYYLKPKIVVDNPDPNKSFETNIPSIIGVSNVKLTIRNATIQTGTVEVTNNNSFITDMGGMMFKGYGNQRKDKITLINSILISKGDYNLTEVNPGSDPLSVVAYVMQYLDELLVFNTIFYSDYTNGLFVQQPLQNQSMITKLYGTFFLNIARTYNNASSGSSVYDSLIYSHPKASYNQSTHNGWKNSGYTGSLYEFNVPLISWDVSFIQTDEFNYLKYGWDDVSVISTEYGEYLFTGYPSIYEDELLIAHGKRDGIGPLWFPEMTPAPITYLWSGGDIYVGDIINFEVQNPQVYEDRYSPSLYEWFDSVGNINPISDTEWNYLAVVSGDITISLKTTSHNAWYDKQKDIIVTIAVLIADIIQNLTYDSSPLVDNTTTVFNTILSTVTPTPTSLLKNFVGTGRVNFGDNTINNFSGLETGIATTSNTFTKVGQYLVTAEANVVDGSKAYAYSPINVVDIVPNIYYVDLDIEYDDEKWLDLNYGVRDDFEDQTIDSYFDSQFKAGYDTIFMWDEYVAQGTTKAKILTGIEYGSFSIEYSFVRREINGQPKFFLTVDGTKELYVEWDYITDSLSVYVIGNRDKKIKYGDFINDLYCDGALKKIDFRISFDTENVSGVESSTTGEIISYYGYIDWEYSIDGGQTWIRLYRYDMTSTGNLFDNVYPSVQGTIDTGLGYVEIKANNVTGTLAGFGNGTELYPFTYHEMVERTNNIGGTTIGGFGDKYLCRNSRVVEAELFEIDDSKEFEIDVWDVDKYGPWMIVYRGMITDVGWAGARLSNGIIYNIPLSSQAFNINVSFLYDMFLVWNGSGRIGLIRSTNRYSNDSKVDIIGSTVNSKDGFYTE